MCLTTFDKVISFYKYLIKISIVLVLYLLSAKLGDLLTFFDVFNHGQYPPYWPPSGVAFALVLLMGPSVWPGIAIASLLLMPESYWFLDSNPAVSDVIIVSSSFTLGRIIEPLIGYYLFQKLSEQTNPFQTPRTAFNFIISALIISVIGAGMSSTGIQIASPSSTEVYLVRMGAWYVDNVVGILVFTPFIMAVYYFVASEYHKKLRLRKSIWIVVISFALVCIYFLYSINLKVSVFHKLVINCLPFLIIPFLFWLAFKYHTAVSSLAVIATSLVVVYFTTHGMGPFAMGGDWQNSVLLLQSFLLVATISILISAAVANERRTNEQQLKVQAIELQKANQSLRATMTHLNEALIKAEESDQLKSAFLSNLSHEIRTPMNAVLGFAELLERPNLQDDKREAFLKLIRERSKDLLRTLNDILDISMITAGQMSSVKTEGNMHDFLDRLLVKFQSETTHLANKDITVTLKNTFPIPQGDVVADFNNLHHVLMNLLSNSAKFTEMGYIEITCMHQSPNEFLFSIVDSGIGIPADQRGLIFKPFRQASLTIHQQYGGSGLGLAICKGLVELWGGRIWVESETGKGTAFYFTMPYATA